jgi:hypothetical protein
MYPNQLRTVKQIKEFMTALAKHLLVTFKQNRITMRTLVDDSPFIHTVMFESESAQVSRSIQEFSKQ